MLAVIAVVIVLMCLPLILRVLWMLVKVHFTLVALFLPAGLLLSGGHLTDLRLYFAVTAAWGLVLLALLTRRRPSRQRASHA